MAGGSGTRFWPLSRARNPKQFLSIITQNTLLEETILRLRPLIQAEQTWIVGNAAHKSALEKLHHLVPKDQILYEPLGRNTAACIGWAAVQILKKDPDAVMVVLPSDHFISPVAPFRKLIAKAATLAKKTQGLFTIGIRPTFPHVGYGYIEVQSRDNGPEKVLDFHEKPSLNLAESYIQTGRFFWNSGMFIWTAEKIMAMFRQYLPDHAQILDKIAALPTKSSKLKALYEKFENISIDYGIMEKAIEETYLLAATFEWSDIGSWAALEHFLPQDKQGNAIRGHCIAIDSTNNVVFSEHRKVALVDVKDMVVVDTPDAILVMPKSSDQKIKTLVQQLPLLLQ